MSTEGPTSLSATDTPSFATYKDKDLARQKMIKGQGGNAGKAKGKVAGDYYVEQDDSIGAYGRVRSKSKDAEKEEEGEEEGEGDGEGEEEGKEEGEEEGKEDGEKEEGGEKKDDSGKEKGAAGEKNTALR